MKLILVYMTESFAGEINFFESCISSVVIWLTYTFYKIFKHEGLVEMIFLSIALGFINMSAYNRLWYEIQRFNYRQI